LEEPLDTITPYLRGRAFAPDAIEVMTEAYSKARDFLRPDPQTLELLAVRIVALGSAGVRDADKLAAEALAPFCQGSKTEAST
jgi:hypothetical protein